MTLKAQPPRMGSFVATLRRLGAVSLQSDEQDCPPYLRAASGLAWLQGQLLAVQDDAAFVALMQPPAPAARAIPLWHGGIRLFSDAQGNKADKPDLESVVMLEEDLLLALGSGSHANRKRDRGVLVRPGSALVINLNPLYEEIRAVPLLRGEAINLEAAVVRGDHVLLIHRANGLRSDGSKHFNVVLEFPLGAFKAFVLGQGSVPAVESSLRLDLGDVGAWPLGITDAAIDANGRMWMLASAEATVDATLDGVTEAASLILWSDDGTPLRAPIRSPEGTPLAVKCEGLSFAPGSATEAWVVDDTDDIQVPSSLWHLTIDGAESLR